MDAASALPGVLLGAAAVLAAAKAHGRQVRLERELAGFDAVDFMAENPAQVEAIWARDRRAYWPAFAGAGLGVLAARVALAPSPWWLVALEALAAALLGGFLLAGLASLLRFERARRGAAAKPAAWVAQARRGSAFWWGAALALALAWRLAWP